MRELQPFSRSIPAHVACIIHKLLIEHWDGPRMDTEMNTGMDSGMNTGMDTGLDTGMDTRMNTRMDLI